MSGGDPLDRPEDAPKGIYGDDGRPTFFADAAMDRVIATMLEMASELWVLTERVETIERVAAGKGHVTLEELRNYVPPAEESAERRTMRDEFVHRLLGPLREKR